MEQIMKLKALAGALVAAGVIAAGAGMYEKFETPLVHHARAATTENGPAAPAVLPDFQGIVSRNGAAVVNITVSGKADKTAQQSPWSDPDNPFNDFFRRFQIPLPQGPMPLHGQGSGFIVSADGVVLTNAHVVNNADRVTVKLTDKREFTAKVIGVDKPSDVAVLKIDATNLPTLNMDTADDVHIGEWVVAIGSPFGFENSVTAGIVSAKARSLPGDPYVPFLQTDVAVNPGNSGGPLFNMKGEVIGINSQIYSRSGGYQGISFAIPIQVALNVKDQLLEHGHVTRGRIGVTIQDVNQGLADAFNMKMPGGALVSSVDKNGPAAKAGIEPGDIIVGYNDRKVSGSEGLPALVANTAPGTSADLEVLRKGQTRHIDVKVAELDSSKAASPVASMSDHGRLGLALRQLTPEERKASGVTGGLLVEDAAGPAAEAGIQAGDVILSLNNTPVSTVRQLQEVAAKAGKHVALLVQRQDSRIYVPMDLG
jgi:serine protease Do